MKKLLLLLLLLPLSLSAQMTVRSNMSQFTPSLNLNFMQGVMPPELTFTRSGTATVTTSTGSLSVVGANVPRFDYDPNSVVYSGQNLVPYSQKFISAGWGGQATSANVTENNLIAPDGTMTGSTYTQADVNNEFLATAGTIGLVGGVPYTLSCYFKQGTKPSANITFDDKGFGGNRYGAQFVWATQTLNATFNNTNGQGVAPTVSYTNEANGWIRIRVTFVTRQDVGTAVIFLPRFGSGTGGGTTGIWGVQLERGITAGAYIPTNGTASAGTITATTLKGLLIEEGRTNLTNYSTLPDSWGKAAPVIKTANATTAPDGSVVPSFTNTANTAACIVTNSGAALANSTTYTRSVYVKPLGGDVGRKFVLESTIGNPGSGNIYSVTTYDLSTLAMSNTNGATGLIIPAGNGWYRCIQTFTTLSAGNANALQNYIGGYGPVATIGTYALWGAQCELGAFATSLIPTMNNTVTRGSDDCKLTSVAGWYNRFQGTVSVEYWPVVNSANMGVFSINDAQPQISRFDLRSINGTGFFTVAGVNQSTPTGIPVVLGAINRYAISYGNGSMSLTKNGFAGVNAGTITDYPVVTQLRIGALDAITNANILNGWIRYFRYWPTKRPNSYLQALTN